MSKEHILIETSKWVGLGLLAVGLFAAIGSVIILVDSFKAALKAETGGH
jgi:hypothetical protein